MLTYVFILGNGLTTCSWPPRKLPCKGVVSVDDFQENRKLAAVSLNSLKESKIDCCTCVRCRNNQARHV